MCNRNYDFDYLEIITSNRLQLRFVIDYDYDYDYLQITKIYHLKILSF